jgi:beta-glucosidase
LACGAQVMFDETITLPPGADMVEGIMKPPQQLAVVELEAGRDTPVELSYRPASSGTELGGAEVTMLTVRLNAAPVFDQLCWCRGFRSVVELALAGEISRS